MTSTSQTISSGPGSSLRRKLALFGSTSIAAAAMLGLAAPAQAQSAPTGGTVTAGSATISSSGQTVTINQSSQQAAINWQTFSIGKDN